MGAVGGELVRRGRFMSLQEAGWDCACQLSAADGCVCAGCSVRLSDGCFGHIAVTAATLCDVSVEMSRPQSEGGSGGSRTVCRERVGSHGRAQGAAERRAPQASRRSLANSGKEIQL